MLPVGVTFLSVYAKEVHNEETLPPVHMKEGLGISEKRERARLRKQKSRKNIGNREKENRMRREKKRQNLRKLAKKGAPTTVPPCTAIGRGYHD